MIEYIILLSIAFIGLVAGSFTDLKTREVPDWINFSLIASALGVRMIYSAISFDWSFLIEGLIGLVFCVVLGYLTFYTGQWGGGDSKMLMALGALIGLKLEVTSLLFGLLINILFAGAVYGLVYSIVLAWLNRKKFLRRFEEIRNDKNIIRTRKFFIIFSILTVILSFIFIKEPVLIVLIVFIVLFAYLSFYMVIFVKAVEHSAMYRFIDPASLTEGEWIAQNYYNKRKKICGPKDLGIGKDQINQLIALKRQGKIKNVKIKVGVPFVPSFLLAYIITLILGNWWIGFF